MPIIEYFHLTKTYRVSIAKTVEWQATICTVKTPSVDCYCSGDPRYAGNWSAAYAPFVGYREDSSLDAEVVLETADDKEAFSKMTELWANWQKNNFNGVVHA